jgi:predicted transcriptional regulator
MQKIGANIADWMSMQDIAYKQGMSVKTVYHLNKLGLGPITYRFGRRYMVKVEDYEQWVRENRHLPK